jgi:hypothetical protein
MKLTLERPEFQVIDDVLPADEFKRLWKYVRAETYWFVHTGGWAKVWRLEDGNPLNGALTYSNQATAGVLSQNGKVQLPPHRFYPCGEAVDLLIDFIRAHLGEWAALIGREDVDWVGFTTRPFLYPRGTALSWHADAVGYTGSYTYYAHPYWNVQYGGELLIADRVTPMDNTEEYHLRQMDNTEENERLLAYGIGTYIEAKPNRLIIMRPGLAHCIKPVTAAAGDRARAGITGFFVGKPKS